MGIKHECSEAIFKFKLIDTEYRIGCMLLYYTVEEEVEMYKEPCIDQDREQASANLYGKAADKSISSHEGGNTSSLRRSARKSNLKPTGPSRGTTAKNNQAI